MSEDGLGRRGFLKSAGALLAGTSGASALRAKQIQKTHDGGNYTGIPEKYIDSPEFYNHLEQTYPDSDIQEFDSDDRNMILDYHVIGDINHLEPTMTVVENDFERMGIEVTSLLNPESYELDQFMDDYGMEANNIVGGTEGVADAILGDNTQNFWYEQTDDVMKEAAIQVIYIQEPEGYEEGLEITHNSNSHSSTGVAIGDRASVFFNSLEDFEHRSSQFNLGISVTEHEKSPTVLA